MDDMKKEPREGRAAHTNSDESNYVDLDMKPDGPKTVKVTFTGDGNQLSVIKSDWSKQEDGGGAPQDPQEQPDRDQHSWSCPGTLPGQDEPALDTPTKLSPAEQDSGPERPCRAEPERSDCSEHACSEGEELQYTDMCRSSRTESVLSERSGSDTLEDESHYITTHEIQLAELDHDVDYDLGRGGCWEFEDDNLVYSFVDYASFESDDTQEGTLILEGRSLAAVQSNLGGPVVSTEPEESDLCASSDESVCKNLREDTSAGKIHLSIKTSSRAVTDPVSVFDSTTCGYAQQPADRSRFALVNPGARPAPLCDRAPYFIPAPGRQHLATKLRRKDINEYSSGASSSISELDDADKEVRNLTAKSFRSLACPYFDAINLSTSSESSVSEYGLNKWSAYVDWNYGTVSRGSERSVIAHKTSSTTLEMNKSIGNKWKGNSITGIKAPPAAFYALNQRTSQQASSVSKQVQRGEPDQPVQRGVTLNFRCVEAHEGGRGSKSSRKIRPGQVTNAVLTRSGCKMQYHHTDSVGETHKKAIFASSLLKNVISKKMQFEQERKMERGEICDTHPAASPCFQIRDHDGLKDKTHRGLQRQTSETGSAFTGSSTDEQRLEGSRGEENSKAAEEAEKGQNEPQKSQLIHSQSSAFNVLKEDEPESREDPGLSHESDTQPCSKGGQDNSSMLTKLLFVPSCQLLSKDQDFTDDLQGHLPATAAPLIPQKCEKELKTTNSGNIVGTEDKEKGGKTPEIKICLRSVKENQGCTLNIASLLTPKINYNMNTLRTADSTKCHILSAADRVPSFTVRDIRETKCKLQTPIYQVRDVRKLVKSSYRFVSLDNSENKISAAADKVEEKATIEPGKHVLPSPIVIKCNSVNTKSQIASTQEKLTETGPVPEMRPAHCETNRVQSTSAKQKGHPDQGEVPQNLEIKPAKQRQDKLTGEPVERRNEPTIPKQGALEKLKAAVRTMEQLYVFDRNEWKRKTQAPRPIADSHVLSLITREEQSAEEPERANTDRVPPGVSNTAEPGSSQGVHRDTNAIHLPHNHEDIKAQSQQSKTFTNKSVLHFGNKSQVSVSSNSKQMQPSAALKSLETPAAPLSVKIEPPKQSRAEHGKVRISGPNPAVTQSCFDSENYLTIPGLRNTSEPKEQTQERVSEVCKNNVNVNTAPEQAASSLMAESPSATIYHHPTATTAPQRQQQVLLISPCAPTVSPTSPTVETIPQMQRKMLLDPTTGHYYLVDTPIPASTKKLFDPETGQYVEVPMSHSPVAPVTPVTPLPLSLSPLALGHTTGYAPTYMIYPSFIPSPSLAAQVVLPLSPCHSEGPGGECAAGPKGARRETATSATERMQNSTTGGASQGLLPLPVSFGHMTSKNGTVSSERKPVISITTQQGPRIIAPPSFDGTTMSFVVEHR